MIRSMTRSSVLNKQDYRSMLAGNDGFDPSSFQLISTQILSGSASSVTFSSLPSTYSHLQIRYVVRQSTAGTIIPMLNFNGDTAANYAWHRLYGNGTTVNSDSSISTTQILALTGPGGSDTAGVFMPAIVDILDYRSTSKNKTVRYLTGAEMNNTARVMALTSGLWASTAAVSSLTLTALSGSFAIGSRFSIYGVKGV